MSGLDGGYSENLRDGANYARGRLNGIVEGVARGKAAGFQEGYEEGHEAGCKEGWNAAVQDATKKMNRANDTIATLDKYCLDLKQQVSVLEQAANEWEEKHQQLLAQHNELVARFNRNLVFMNTVRLTLDEVFQLGGEPSHHVQAIFAEKYEKQMSKFIAQQVITVPIHEDPIFLENLPKAGQMINDILASVAARREPGTDG